MKILNKARKVVQNINRTSQLLEGLQLSVDNQSHTVNRQLTRLLQITGGAVPVNDDDEDLQPPSIARPSQTISGEPEGIFGRFVRPLEKLADYDGKAGDVTYAGIESWLQTSACKKIQKYLVGYPSDSLTGGVEFLYHIVRTTKPRNVVEVGTYYAGTSEIMARALWENGRGMLHTTDPFGIERCPIIISKWPAALRKHIQFYPYNSMEFFETLERNRVGVDVAFIDGNHDYEYAYFDLLSAAKLIRPNGIVVVDNIEQSGPFWATVEFLRQNPEWTEIGDVVTGFSADKPFDPSRRFMGSISFAILKAPGDYVVKSMPLATGQVPYAKGQVSGIRMQMARPAPKGTLHAQIFLRGFSSGLDPEQMIVSAKAELSGEVTMDMKIPQAVKTIMSGQRHDCRHTVEVVLFWQPHGHGEALHLQSAPEPFA